MLEERYQQRESQLSDQFQAEAQGRIAVLEHAGRTQALVQQQQAHEALSTIEQLRATFQTLSNQAATGRDGFSSDKRSQDDREQ